MGSMEKGFPQEHIKRAEEKNRYLGFIEKRVFGKKVSAMDVAMAEAEKMNAAIDRESETLRAAQKEGGDQSQTLKEAVTIVSARPEFQPKGDSQIEKEEYALARTAHAIKLIAENNFEKASLLLHNEKFKKNVNDATRQVMNTYVREFVREHLNELAQKRNGAELIKALTWFGEEVGPGEIEANLINAPVIQGAIYKEVIKSLKYPGDNERLLEKLEKYASLGMLSDELKNSTEIQEATAARVVFDIKRDFSGAPAELKTSIERMRALGLFGGKQLSEIAVIRDAVTEKLGSLARGPLENFRKARTFYAELGVVEA